MVDLDKLRVLIVGINYAPETTGIGPYTSGLASALVKRGHMVKVVTSNPHYPAWFVEKDHRIWKTTSKIEGVNVIRLQHFVPKKPTGILRLVSEVSFGMRSWWHTPSGDQIALLVSPALVSTAITSLKLHLFSPNTKQVIWVQDLYGLGLQQTAGGSAIVGKFFLALERILFKSVDAVVTIHQSMADALIGHYSVPEVKVNVIRNWSHIDTKASLTREHVRTSNGWEQKVVVLHSGNMGQKQALSNVIEAAKLAGKSASDLLFVLMGDGSERENLMNMAKGVPNLQLMSPVSNEDFFATLQAADYLLVNEDKNLIDMAFPSKLTSYFAAAKPVIAATNVKSATAAEITFHEAGILVEPMQPRLLVQTVLAAEKDKNSVALMAARGHKHAVNNLSPEGATKSFEDLFSRLLSG